MSLSQLPQNLRVLVLSYTSSSAQEGAFAKSYKGTIVTLPEAQHADISKYKDQEFGAIVAFMNLQLSPPFLQHVIRVINPGGYFCVQVPKNLALERSLVYAGFTDVSTTTGDDSAQVLARRPPWNAGASAPLSLKRTAKKADLEDAKAMKPSQPVVAVTVSSSNTKAVWNLKAEELNDDDVPLADPAALLKKDELKMPLKAEGCGVPGSGNKARKACKNCSCGLADQEKAEANKTTKSTPVSACGSCGLGDAFRCSTCPYLGMPAFKPGEVVKLQL
jgi:hypothetical protein